jgi:hypothetical protein
MATLRQVKTLAARLGATVEDEKIGHHHECRVQSPHRKHWKALGVHEMIADCYQPWKPDYADLIDSMNYGLDDCVGECEWCDDE